MPDKKAFRAEILHCLGDPGEHADATQVEYFADGLLIVEDGYVAGLGDAETLLPGLADDIELIDQRGNLICPGFIDCHVHFSQVDIIASYGEQLLDWLNRYAYPAEQRFSDAQYADEVANFFTDELLRNGTTTALVFPTVHEESVGAIFSAASKRNMRLLSGKILMDQHCPESVRDDAESAYSVSRRLLEKWHGKGRLGYALTPRFAVTSSEAQLAAVGKLAAEFPDVHIHTHLAENHEEVDLIAKQFPWSRSYLDVYDHFGLVRERSVFAHCLHLDDMDREHMANSGSAIAFCPTSNLFLGSGLFDLRSARESGIRVGLATDVGGGTSLNMLRTMSEAYKVLHLESQSLPGFRALYLATLGAAEALYLDDKIGNFATGKEADFVVLNYAGAEITTRRLAKAGDIAEKLFALIMLGDDRNVSATHVMGRKV
ncbi:MAG: guanine deaminase [Gammaproteobacteria bacterium]|nr:MAG: guanine deaminase [Gammaproteobacteria bacterium]